MELKTVVINGQTFINTALVMDLEQSPSEYVPPANGLMAGMLRVDGVQSQAKTNMGKPRVHIHADGRVEFNEDVDWNDPASVLGHLTRHCGMVSIGEMVAGIAEEAAKLERPAHSVDKFLDELTAAIRASSLQQCR